MSALHLSKRGIAGIVLAIGAVAILVACGGGGSGEKDAAVQEVERAQALHFLDKLPVSWSVPSLTFSLNPGARQDVQVTLTTTKTLSNAKIVFVPDFRNAVTVTPDTIPALAAGQSATVTLTFAPAATDTRKLIAGIVLLYDKSTTTISRPLPVKVTLVNPESVNGVAIPPEPPAGLNNATLAGFDTNGNGVRDDVERVLAQKFGGTPDYTPVLNYAKTFQAVYFAPTPLTRSAALSEISKVMCSTNNVSREVRIFEMGELVFSTNSRKAARHAFDDVLIGFGGRELTPCGN